MGGKNWCWDDNAIGKGWGKGLGTWHHNCQNANMSSDESSSSSTNSIGGSDTERAQKNAAKHEAKAAKQVYRMACKEAKKQFFSDRQIAKQAWKQQKKAAKEKFKLAKH